MEGSYLKTSQLLKVSSDRCTDFGPVIFFMVTVSVQLQDVVADIQPDKMGFQIQQYTIITCVDCVGHRYPLRIC